MKLFNTYVRISSFDGADLFQTKAHGRLCCLTAHDTVPILHERVLLMLLPQGPLVPECDSYISLNLVFSVC